MLMVFQQKVTDIKFIELLNAIPVIHGTSSSIVNKMKKWQTLQSPPGEDITIIKKWVRSTDPDDHSHKIARCLMWYVVQKYLELPDFDDINIDITIR